MAKITIKDLPEEQKISAEDMKNITGGWSMYRKGTSAASSSLSSKYSQSTFGRNVGAYSTVMCPW